MDGKYQAQGSKMGGFEIKKQKVIRTLKRTRAKSALAKPVATTRLPTSPPVIAKPMDDPWVKCAYVPNHSVILFSLGGDMTLFTGTTIFLTQLQLHLQDLLRIGPQDLEVFVKPNKQILQVEATLFNDHAGVLAVTLVRIWQAGKFHPFQNFPCDDLDVLGSPA